MFIRSIVDLGVVCAVCILWYAAFMRVIRYHFIVSTVVTTPPSVIHEVSHETLEVLQEALLLQKKLEQLALQQHWVSSEQYAINQYGNELQEIYKKYTYTSPALVALGPLGSASIVLKERDLERQLFTIITHMNNLVASHVGVPSESLGMVKEVSEALQQLKTFVARLY